MSEQTQRQARALQRLADAMSGRRLEHVPPRQAGRFDEYGRFIDRTIAHLEAK